MLMLTDREEISRGLVESLEYQEIGRRLGRDSSVISREVARHGGRERYRAAAAHEAACAGRERPKLFAVERSARLHTVVCRQLRQGWSPASIAGRLPVEYAADESCRVSHEAIYQWVYAQPVSTLARELISLRTGRTARKGGRRPPPAPIRIVREYFSKGVEISSDPKYLAMVACDINDRPRKIHNWKKPSELFTELVKSNASTG